MKAIQIMSCGHTPAASTRLQLRSARDHLPLNLVADRSKPVAFVPTIPQLGCHFVPLCCKANAQGTLGQSPTDFCPESGGLVRIYSSAARLGGAYGIVLVYDQAVVG